MSETTGLPGRARRTTRQRTAIVGLLREIDEFRSAQELHEKLRANGEGIGLTTVYRTLQSLADERAVDVVRTDTGESMFRLCSTEHHHHHLLCRECGRAVEVAGPAVERWAAAIAAEHDFTDVSHTIEIFGVCADCR